MSAIEAVAEAIYTHEHNDYDVLAWDDPALPSEVRGLYLDRARAAVAALAAQGDITGEQIDATLDDLCRPGTTTTKAQAILRALIEQALARQAAVHATREAELSSRANNAERALRQAEQFGIGEWTVTADAFVTATSAIEKHRTRAEAAEATVERVRALCRWEMHDGTTSDYEAGQRKAKDEIAAALADPKEGGA